MLAVVALVVGLGAIPSRIPFTEPEYFEDLAIGSASVAYVDPDATPVLVDASTVLAHRVLLPDFPTQQAFRRTAELRRGSWLALSPDGRRVAYPTVTVEEDARCFTTSWYRVVDLTTGESDLVDIPPYGITPLDMSCTADGQIAVVALDKGRINKPVPDVIRWVIDPGTGASSRSPLAGIVAPGGGVSALVPEDQELVEAVQFETASGNDPVSELPADAYPEGAVVQPLGWVEPDVLVASIDPPQSDVVEHPRLVLITSPELPESDVSYREFLPRLPPNLGLSNRRRPGPRPHGRPRPGAHPRLHGGADDRRARHLVDHRPRRRCRERRTAGAALALAPLLAVDARTEVVRGPPR